MIDADGEIAEDRIKEVKSQATEWRTSGEGEIITSMKTTIQAELPPELVSRAKAFVDAGWVGDFDELLAEALRRYLESHASDLTQSFMRDDVEWGLHGRN